MSAKNKQQDKQPEPGSRDYKAQVADKFTEAIGMPGLPDQYTNEAVAERTEGRPFALTQVIRDQYEGDIASGRRPTDEIAAPFVRDNPDLHFRWGTDVHRGHVGMAGYEKVYYPEGHPKAGQVVTHLNDKRFLMAKTRADYDRTVEDRMKYNESLRDRAEEATTEAMDNLSHASDGYLYPISASEMRANRRGGI